MLLGHIIDAIFFLGGGVSCALMACGKIGVHKDPEEKEKWLKKYGGFMAFLSLFLLGQGVYHVIRMFV